MRSVSRHVGLLMAVAVGTILAGSAAAAAPAPTPTPAVEGGVSADGHHCRDHHHRPCPCPTPTMYPIPMPPAGGPIAQPPPDPGQLPVTGPDHTVAYAALGGGVLAVIGTGLVLVTSRRRRRNSRV